MSDKIIQVKNVSKWFGDFLAIKDINLEVFLIQKIVVCGPSGSGKSTLIRCINRLEEHQKGKIVVDGIELSENTKKVFQELIKKFPNSIYSKDAKKKILIANDQLAAKEMNVGRYYQQKNRHLAAIERFKIVINDYNTTAQTPEALYRLTESYLSLGIIEEAKKTTAVLSYNFKESNWYKLSYDLFKKYGYKKNGKHV